MCDDSRICLGICFVIIFLGVGLLVGLGLYVSYDDADNNNNNNNYIDNTCTRRNCELSGWSQWSGCENPCEGETYTTRYVLREAECDGIPCSYYHTYVNLPCDRGCQYDGTMHLYHPQEQCSCPSGFNGKCCECKVEDCILSEWSDWSNCSRKCFGTTNRSRSIEKNPQCGGTECPLPLSEERECNHVCLNGGSIDYGHRPTCNCPDGFTGECCGCKVQDCILSEWDDWSNCSRECGPFGTKTRSRSIEKNPQCGGTECPLPPSLSEEIECNQFCYNGGSLDSQDVHTRPTCNCPDGFTDECCGCKVQDCIMTEWGDWSDCRVIRGARGEQSRTRTIDTPPTCNGTACSTNRLEKRSCDICGNNGTLEPSQNWCRCRHGFSGQFCECKDIDCKLSQWSNWSPCENAVGLHTRSRYVIRNSTCAGKCNGLLKDERSCEGSTPNVNQSSFYLLCLGAIFIGLLVLLAVLLYRLVEFKACICLGSSNRKRRGNNCTKAYA